MEFVYERLPAPADEESDWLYWDPPRKRWHRVILLAVPESPTRVRIQHLDADMRGKAEWVPARRCKVPWRLRDAFDATQAAWTRLASHDPEAPYRRAAEFVTLELLEESTATPALRSAALEVADLDQLSAATGIAKRELAGHPDTIVEDDITHVPWPTVARVVQELCRRYPDVITSYVHERDREEHELGVRRQAEGGAWYDDETFADDRFAKRVKRWAREDEAARRILMQWADVDVPGIASRYAELRDRHIELTLALLPALDQLSRIRSNKSDLIAAEIRAIIDQPLP
ncbi:hypothetical protein [Microbacterium sp. Nx66]|uniref:hypothetical protein n=1 Tax=Microbacterium sp. Nx66 TaxID=2766784 RepID=UPI001656E6E9|nr:hypothetical protein [Microbacterium sp. Nx66]